MNDTDKDDGQIKEREADASEKPDDGVPRMIMSRNGYPIEKTEGGPMPGLPQAEEQESLHGSIDAQTQAIPRDQMSIYASHKDYRSDHGLRKEI